MAKDLTVSRLDRQNILNNDMAIKEIKEKSGLDGIIWEDKIYVTREMTADFFEVDVRTVSRYLEQNNEELTENGYEVLKGKRLKSFMEAVKNSGKDINVPTKTTVLGVFDFKSFLNLAMLMSESEKARALRQMMLDIVIDLINRKTGGGTKYINQRDKDFLFSSLGMLLDQFILCEELEDIQNELNGFICTFDGRERVCVTRLLRNSISGSNSSIHKEYIAENYSILNIDDILDFSFANWLILSQENVSKLMEETIRIYEEQKRSAYHVYPDPLESNLEIINLFYITEVINDLSPLDVMKDKSVFLQFFLNAEEFDYEKVDFSHYMWENIARRPRFMKIIVEHKDKIIPKIQKRIQVETATEMEKKILYGYLLEKGDLF